MNQENLFNEDQQHNKEYSVNFTGIIFRKIILSISSVAKPKIFKYLKILGLWHERILEKFQHRF